MQVKMKAANDKITELEQKLSQAKEELAESQDCLMQMQGRLQASSLQAMASRNAAATTYIAEELEAAKAQVRQLMESKKDQEVLENELKEKDAKLKTLKDVVAASQEEHRRELAACRKHLLETQVGRSHEKSLADRATQEDNIASLLLGDNLKGCAKLHFLLFPHNHQAEQELLQKALRKATNEAKQAGSSILKLEVSKRMNMCVQMHFGIKGTGIPAINGFSFRDEIFESPPL
eukprot:scaffold7195_cov21-Tisochrysis_lutea.AAC.3